MVHVLGLDPELPVGGRGQQGANLRHHWAVRGAHHNGGAVVEVPIHENYVHGAAQAVDHFYFQHRALQVGAERQVLGQALLRQPGQHVQQVVDAFPRNRRRGDQGHRGSELLVFPVQLGVQAFLHQLHANPFHPVVELFLGGRRLQRESLPEFEVLALYPTVAAVHLEATKIIKNQRVLFSEVRTKYISAKETKGIRGEPYRRQ